MSPHESLQAPSRCDTAAWITLRWTCGSRYYRVHLEQDLWADWLLTQVNGRIGAPVGSDSRPALTQLGGRVIDVGGGRETPASTRISLEHLCISQL